MSGSDALNAYRTVQNSGIVEYVVQKSRFIGHCFPACDVRDAEKLLDGVRKEYWDATHNCYALRVGTQTPTARSADDGEPSGTAGVPILTSLTQLAVTNVLCVVTRYFGGVLLGAGGLVRAYAHTASEAVKAAGVITMSHCRAVRIETPYSYWSAVERTVRACGIEITNTLYEDKVRALVWIEEDRAQMFADRVQERTEGRVIPSLGETAFRALD